MAANIIIHDVTITPNPVQTNGDLNISVSAESLMGSLAFVGSYVGSYVNITDAEIPEKLALAYVGDYTKS